MCVCVLGYVGVLLNQCWREHWCRVRAGSLYLYHEKGEQRVPHTTVALKGCEVVPGLGPKHPFALRILKGGAELAALEVVSVLCDAFTAILHRAVF